MEYGRTQWNKLDCVRNEFGGSPSTKGIPGRQDPRYSAALIGLRGFPVIGFPRFAQDEAKQLVRQHIQQYPRYVFPHDLVNILLGEAFLEQRIGHKRPSAGVKWSGYGTVEV